MTITQYLDLPDGRLAYDDTGTGPLVVCVPAMADLRDEYRFLTPALVAAGYRVVALDLRGMGESSARWPEYGSEPTGRDLVALLRHLAANGDDAGPALIYGCSVGAAAAIHVAADAPELVRGLVLAGPFVRDAPATLATRIGARVLLLPGLTRPLALAYWPKWEPNPPADLKAHLAKLRANLREPGRTAALRGYFRSSHRAAGARLSQVHTPVLTIMGTADVDFPDPAAEARWIQERLGGELLLVEGAGHHPHVEYPDRIVAAVAAFDTSKARE
jgi:pimeloyl-ACP methyl ester carboxylesterase